jgi:hypothetical protein
MKAILAVLLLVAVSALGQEQPQDTSVETQKYLDAIKPEQCTQSKMDMVNAWSEQLGEDGLLEQLRWQELEDRITSAFACIALIDREEARKHPDAKTETRPPRSLAYEVHAQLLIVACLTEQRNRMLQFIEKKGLKHEFKASSLMLHNADVRP